MVISIFNKQPRRRDKKGDFSLSASRRSREDGFLRSLSYPEVVLHFDPNFAVDAVRGFRFWSAEMRC